MARFSRHIRSQPQVPIVTVAEAHRYGERIGSVRNRRGWDRELQVDTVSVAPLHRVTVTINASAASGGKLFGHLVGTE